MIKMKLSDFLWKTIKKILEYHLLQFGFSTLRVDKSFVLNFYFMVWNKKSTQGIYYGKDGLVHMIGNKFMSDKMSKGPICHTVKLPKSSLFINIFYGIRLSGESVNR